MSRYIKLEDAINVLYSGFVTKSFIEDELKKLPTIDIVKCEDCRNNIHETIDEIEENWCGIFRCEVASDDFCSYGEKQVTSKLNKADDSLLTEDLQGCKEQESKLESNDTVSKAVFEQIKWERDTALQTLEEHGIGLGERKVDTPTNTSTDLISRQAAIEAIEKAVFKGVAKSAIESLPPVEPKRPQGEWHLVDHLWECNRCHCRQNKKKPTNFCPDCGALMTVVLSVEVLNAEQI